MRRSVAEPVAAERSSRALALAYRGLLRAAVQEALTYRGRMLLWLLTGLFPLLLMAVWLTVVDSTGPAAGWDRSDFASYYVAAAVLFQLTTSALTWRWDDDMRSGELSARLLRPVEPFHQYAALEVGSKAVMAVLSVPVLIVATVALPLVRYPAGPGLALVVPAVLLALALSVVMSMAFALVAFWTTQAGNLYALWWGVGAFLSGWIAPLDLMPAWLRSVALALPFRAVVGFPLELALGRLDAGEVLLGFAVALGWLAAFAALYRVGWRAGVRRYQAVGG